MHSSHRERRNARRKAGKYDRKATHSAALARFLSWAGRVALSAAAGRIVKLIADHFFNSND